MYLYVYSKYLYKENITPVYVLITLQFYTHSGADPRNLDICIFHVKNDLGL